ncbi:hypothetical protein Thermo_01215 [Thermoplasmatales archaeon]|nr:hypothetical protein Thermo_01215 [Thermoplasmatales archaeon]
MPTKTVHTVQGGNPNYETNGVVLSTHPIDTNSGPISLNEQYNPAIGQMQIYIPIEVGSGTNQTRFNDVNDGGYNVNGVGKLVSSESISGFPADQLNSLYTDSGGINVTFPNGVVGGTSTSEYNVVNQSLVIALGLVPILGAFFSYAGFAASFANYGASSTATLGGNGNASIIESLAVNPNSGNYSKWINGTGANEGYDSGFGQNVFASEMIGSLLIDKTDFGRAGGMNLNSTNYLGEFLEPTGWNIEESGSSCNIKIPFVPANTITGTVYENGVIAANQDIVLTQTNANNSVTQFYETTNSSGQYRFFAQPGVTYEIQAIIPGGLSNGVQETLANDENGTPMNLAITAPAGAVFTESGLTSGATWSVTMNGTTVSGTTSTLTIPDLQYGDTYSYSINAQGFTADPSSGSVSVNDLTTSESVGFSPSDSLTFSESGLASGTQWSLKLTYPGGTQSTPSTTGSSITFNNVPYGTYDWTYSIPSGYGILYQSGTASISPTSNTATETGSYYAVGDVTFTETGLSGQTWGVSIGTSSQSTSASTIVFTNIAANSGVPYTVSAPSSYIASPQTGEAQEGTTTNIAFTYEPGYSVTFTESGYPIAPGDEWGVSMGGTTIWSQTSSLSFTMHDGSYSYSVPKTASSKYYYIADPSSGSVTVSGSNVNVQVHFYEDGPVRCVNATTEILMANGTYIHADQVIAGDEIMTLNTTTGAMQPEIVQHVYVTAETSQYTINGYLRIAQNQDVLTQNGYVSADNLTTHDWMYNVYSHSWEKVRSISSSTGTYTMYDFQVSGNSDFIAYSSVIESTTP